MTLARLPTYPRSAYPPIAERIRKAPARTTPDRRGWGPLATGRDAVKEQLAKNVALAIIRPRDGRTFTPSLLPELAPHGQLCMDIVSAIGEQVGFEWRGAKETDGGIGSFFMRDIRESDQPSWHSWCQALDLMTGGSPRALTWRSVIPPWVVDLFESAGWGWGGRWGNGRTVKYDPHHFEYRYRPGDVATDMENAKVAALRIAKALGVTLSREFWPAGHEEPAPPPPPPPSPPEDDMPKITKPLIGHEAVVGDPASVTTVRSRPSPARDAVVRRIPKGQTETWTIVGWVTGEHSDFGNSDQWLVHLAADGSWEYTAKGNVREVLPPAASKRIAALEAAAAEDLKAMHGALTHNAAAKGLLEERIR